jgi:hypothetical protein
VIHVDDFLIERSRVLKWVFLRRRFGPRVASQRIRHWLNESSGIEPPERPANDCRGADHRGDQQERKENQQIDPNVAVTRTQDAVFHGELIRAVQEPDGGYSQ